MSFVLVLPCRFRVTDNVSRIDLRGGEDYELLFTIAQEDFDKIKENPNMTIIGYMTEVNEGVHLITRANQQIEITAQGWNSFKE